MNQIKHILDNAILWAKDAGRVQLQYFRSNNLDIATKFNNSDIVTVADKASEKLLIRNIHTHYPSHSIISEESGVDTRIGEFCWVIDPLDGTTNFSQGLPLFAVSIGIKHNSEIVAGVVHIPYLDETFYAIKGGGAYLNDNAISPSIKQDLRQCVVATGFPIDKDSNSDNNADNFNRIMPRVRGIRRLGAAAVDLCYVAAGILDGYWEMNLHEWDVSAGSLIAEESGVIVTRFRPDRNFSILAAPPSIHSQLRSLLSQNSLSQLIL